MKKIVIFCLSLSSLTLSAQQNPVIVELFTSQGCSSCPTADKNLTTILKSASESGKPVFGLSFHVDYWNYLGWKDPYSKKEFTARQRSYAQEMNLRSIYTPQMIVNGRSETIGSDAEETKKLIAQALAKKPLYTIHIHGLFMNNGSLSFTYLLDHAPSNETMNIAIVEKDIENNVPRGENSGRKLHHDNVVRSFSSDRAVRTQKIAINVGDVDIEKTSVILYLQDRSLQVVGATAHALQ